MSKYPIKIFREESHNYYRTKLKFFADARIVGKSLEFDRSQIDNTNSFYDYPFVFDFRFVDSNKEIYSEKINVNFNTRISLYAKLNWKQKFLLKREFKLLWIQQTENIKWIVMAIFAGIGSFVALTKFFLECK